MTRIFAAFALFVSAGFAQPNLVRPIWSFPATVEMATSIFVGDVVSGIVDNATMPMTVAVNVKVVRVLKGDLEPGKDIAIGWKFAPGEGENPPAKVPQVRVLWFARKTAGAYEALRSEMIPLAMGGMMTVVPSTPVPSGLEYGPAVPVNAKVARELACAIVDVAKKQTGDNTPFVKERTLPGATPNWLREQDEVQSLGMALSNLDPRSTLDVYRYFSKSEEANLVILGISGRFTAGDATAVFDLERDYARLSETEQANLLPRTVMGLNLGVNLEAAHVLGRLALAENAIPGVDAMFAFRIGQTRRREFLPYLTVMIGSPDPTARAAALYGICDLLGHPIDSRMYCPTSIPMKDREQEKRAVEYWTDWWEQHRAGIAQSTQLPKVQAPARYGRLGSQAQRPAMEPHA